MYDNALTNAERLFTYDNVSVMRDPFGRLFVVTDSPALVDSTGAAYNLGILGYEWDMTAGGKSPDDTKLGASANWRKTATSLKDTAGVLVKTK